MKINIKNLAIQASVGCFGHEYHLKTKIIISATIEYKQIADFTDPKNIINYDHILSTITQTATSKHFAYIEELAFVLSQNIKGVSPLIENGIITVQKCIKGNIVQEISCQLSF